MLRSRLRLVSGSAALLLIGSGLAVGGRPAAALSTLCTSGVRGDVNGDGHAEVVVGERGARAGAGGVHVLYGQRSGLVVKRTGTARDDQYFDQNTPGVPGSSQPAMDQLPGLFGDAVVLGDFDGDGCADVAIGAPGMADDAGSVTVLYGSPAGVVTERSQVFDRDSVGHRTVELGATMAVADLDGDGVDDLAVGASYTTVSDAYAAGAVVVLYGDASGLNRGSTSADFLTADSPTIPGAAARDDRFGGGLAAGDFDGDGRSELAIGILGKLGDGRVQTVERGPAGFSGSPPLDLETTGVPDVVGFFARFGALLAAGDLDGNGSDDLAVGLTDQACLSDCDSYPEDGVVVVYPGTSVGLTGTGSQAWTQDSPGVRGHGKNEAFGSALAVGRFDADPIDDLAIGAVTDGQEPYAHAGSVTLLLGSSTGLTTRGMGGTRYTRDTPGLRGRKHSATFGGSLAAAYVQSATQSSLVIGAPSSDIGRHESAGQIHQLAVTPNGPTGRGSRTLSTATTGVKGNPVTWNEFGLGLG